MFLREHLHARGGGMNAQEHRLEVEAPIDRDHHLAIEHTAIGKMLAQRNFELRKVATQWLEVAALNVDVVARFEHERAKAVPLWFVQPLRAVGNVVRKLRQHRLDGRKKWE